MTLPTAARTTLSQSRTVPPTEAVARALDRLKIFPLPGVVLLPGSIVPLHIFEPRYRQLIADCMASDRVIALANLLPSDDGEDERPAVRPVLGAGVVVFHQSLEDGRSLVLVQGLLRATVDDEIAVDQPYRVVRARELKSRDTEDDGSQAELVRHRLLRLTERLTDEPGRLADLVGSAVITDPEDRQRLLEELHPDRRLDQVSQRLGLLLRRLGADRQTCNGAGTVQRNKVSGTATERDYNRAGTELRGDGPKKQSYAARLALTRQRS
jgi:Lon protease-like protein